MKKITFFCFLILLLICSCKNNDDPTPNLPEVPSVKGKPFLATESTFYGSGLGMSQDPLSYKIDSLKRISEISSYYYKHTISYPDSNLIICYSDSTSRNSHVEETNNIYMENNRVTKICKKQFFKYPDHRSFMELDSTLFTYNTNNNLIQIIFFEKLNESTPYELRKIYEYSYENGNVVQFNRTELGEKTILNYSYDFEPNIDYGEFAPEMPFYLNLGFYYPLIYNKLGKRNVNNIIKVTEEHLNGFPLYLGFNYINYKRIVNTNGELTSIKMSGQVTFSDSKAETTYNDGEVKFTYIYK